MSAGGAGWLASGGGVPQPIGGADGGVQAPLTWSEVLTEPQDEASYIYDQSALRTYDIVIAPSDLAALDAAPAAERYVPAQVRFEGVQYDAAVRYKGSFGAFLAPCTAMTPGNLQQGANNTAPKTGKCSIKVSFNEFDPSGRFYGLKKLQFHSMNHDRSLLRERLAYTMFRQNGVPAPRAVHARVLINGQLEGLFAVVEAIDGRFTRSRFGEGGKGNLYKEVWPMHDTAEVYEQALKTNEDEQPDVGPFVDFSAALSRGDDRAGDHVDWAAMMRFMAVDRVIINDDGPMHFWCTPAGQGNNPGDFGNHNYYWYQELGTGRFWLIPWDMDNSMRRGTIVQLPYDWRQPGECGCSGLLQRPACDPLVQQLIARDAEFESAVDAFLAGPFSGANVDGLIDTWRAQIADSVAESAVVGGAPDPIQWQFELTELQNMISSARTHRGTAY